MRAFFISILALAFALSVHAAALGKRAISALVQLCINDLKSVTDKLAVLKSSIDAASPALSGATYTYISAYTSSLVTSIGPATTNCCAIPDVVVAEESDAFTSAIEAELSLPIDTYYSYTAIRPLITINIWRSLYGYSTNVTTARYATLNTCIVAKTPSDKLASVNALVDQFNAAAVTLRDAYAT